MGGDTVTDLTEVYANDSAGTGKTLSVATYTVNDGNGGNNYTVSTVDDTTGVIDPATLTGSVTAADKIYDALTTATITGRTLGGVHRGRRRDLRRRQRDVRRQERGHRQSCDGNRPFAVGYRRCQLHRQYHRDHDGRHRSAAIVGSVTAANKVYDGDATATLLTRSLTGALGGDDVSYTGGTATFADKNVALGKTVTATGLTLSGTDAGNYTVNSNSDRCSGHHAARDHR